MSPRSMAASIARLRATTASELIVDPPSITSSPALSGPPVQGPGREPTAWSSFPVYGRGEARGRAVGPMPRGPCRGFWVNPCWLAAFEADMSRDDQPGEAQPPAGTATAASLRCYVTKDPYRSCNPAAGDQGHPQCGISLRRLPPPRLSAEPWRQSRRTKSGVNLRRAARRAAWRTAAGAHRRRTPRGCGHARLAPSAPPGPGH